MNFDRDFVSLPCKKSVGLLVTEVGGLAGKNLRPSIRPTNLVPVLFLQLLLQKETSEA